MKKLLFIFFMFLMVGCSSSKKDVTSFFVEDTRSYYALYNINGKQLTEFNISNYNTTTGSIYLVYQSGSVGIMDNNGKMLIPFDTYSNLRCYGDLVLTTNENGKDIVMNKNGAILYSEEDGDTILERDLLSVLDGETMEHKVFNDLGEVVFTSNTAISSIKLDQTRRYAYVGLGISTAKLVDLKANSVIDLGVSGDYVFESSHESTGFVLKSTSDETRKIYVDASGTTRFVSVGKYATMSIDEGGNVVGEAIGSGKTYLLMPSSLEGLNLNEPMGLEFNAYYKDFSNYVYKNEASVYGPHFFYKDGLKAGELVDTQISPEAGYTFGDLFPVYLRNDGYYYYDFTACQIFKEVYQEAYPFDANGLAIVMKDDSYSLINKQESIVTKEGYSRIVPLKDQKGNTSPYYLVENSNHRYGIIHTSGEVVVPISYVGYNAQTISLTYINNEAYLSVENGGRSYVYNLSTKEIVCETEGKFVIVDKGYIHSLDGDFYSLTGRLIYQRDL